LDLAAPDKTKKALKRVHNIRGKPRVPKSGGKQPAVVIIHGAGQATTGTAYAIALTHAGFVTPEPEFWQCRREHALPTPYLAHNFGAPVHTLADAQDEYDEPDSCAKFLASMLAESRKHFTLTVYPDAGHGWDKYHSRTYTAREACLDRGRTVYHNRVEARTKDSLDYAVKFFTDGLKP